MTARVAIDGGGLGAPLDPPTRRRKRGKRRSQRCYDIPTDRDMGRARLSACPSGAGPDTCSSAARRGKIATMAGRMVGIKTFVGLVALLAAQPALAAGRLPNVVIILADDLGWSDVGYHGSEIATPRLDALATEGVVLDRFYAQPACSRALPSHRQPLSTRTCSDGQRAGRSHRPVGGRIESREDAGQHAHLVHERQRRFEPGRCRTSSGNMSKRLESWFGKPLPLR